MEPVGGQGTPSRQYELLGLLGEGGFGAVYLARFLGEGGFEKLVAVKVLNADLEDMVEIARRLRDEARILGLLRHRSIVGVDRLTKLDGRWAVVMEYVVGEDLAQLVRRDRVPTGPALEIIADVASALHAAWHMIGPNGQPLHLLHRDLKPANIRITPDGDVKVLDFGVARAEFDTREAATRSIAFGTPSYMPPERLDLMPDGPEGDIYALGVVLFELVTQERLPQTSANPKRHDRVLSEAQERLRALNIPPQVLQLVLDCMAYEPEARPNARDLEARAVRLSRVLGEDPLRTWAQRGVAREGHGYAPIGGSLSGVVLTEEPPSLLTAWERPAARPQLARTPTPSLVPARTGVCERTPPPLAAPPLAFSPPILANRVPSPLVEGQTARAPACFPDGPLDDPEATRVFPRAPATPSPAAPLGLAQRAPSFGAPAPTSSGSLKNIPSPPPLRMTPPSPGPSLGAPAQASPPLNRPSLSGAAAPAVSPAPPPSPVLAKVAPSGAQPSPGVVLQAKQSPRSAGAAPGGLGVKAAPSGAQPSPGVVQPQTALGRGFSSTPEPPAYREHRSSPAAKAQPVSPPRSRALALGAALFGVVLGGIGVAYHYLGAAEAEVEAPLVEEAPTVVEPTVPEPAPIPGPTVPDPGMPVVEVPTVNTPIVEPPKEPVSPKPKKATIRFVGDARSVVLQLDADPWALSNEAIVVPPGKYEIQAAFGTKGLAAAGWVTVKPGEVVTLECLARYGRCVVDK